MIKSIVLFGVLIGVSTLSLDARAETYQTSFSLKSFYNGIETSYPVTGDSSVVMPRGSVWSCSKFGAISNVSNQYSAAFRCTSGNAVIEVSAVCSQIKEDSDSDSAFLANKGGTLPVRFKVACLTRAKSEINTDSPY